MKFALLFILAVMTIVATAEGYGMYVDHKQHQDNQTRHNALKESKDIQFAKACAEGRTGVVLYYKGVNCVK